VNGHHISEDDLLLYSLQSLSAGQTAAAELHLETCTECRGHLSEIAGDLALLSLSVEQQPIPAGSRERFLSRIGSEAQENAPIREFTASASIAPATTTVLDAPEPNRVIQEVKPRHNWIPVLIPWAAAFAVLVLAGYLGNRNERLNQLLDSDKGQIAQLSAQADRAQQVLDALTSPASKSVTLTEGKATPPPTGHTSYLAEKGALVFVGSNLKPIPANKTYELWIIPADGKAPVPAGLFRPDEHGSANVVLPQLPTGVPAKAFGVTIENAEGATRPTMPIVLSGAAGL
jgi:anti-sigma factor RsiW